MGDIPRGQWAGKCTTFYSGRYLGTGTSAAVNITWDKGDWLYIVSKWDLPDISLTVYNFTKGTTATATATGATYTAMPTLAHVNCGDGYQFSGYTNSIIDELRIDKIARTDEEIQAWYKANAPSTPDEYTTYLSHFDGSLSSEKLPHACWESAPKDVSKP